MKSTEYMYIIIKQAIWIKYFYVNKIESMIMDYRSFIDALKLVNDFISLVAGEREFQREMLEGKKEF